MLRTTLFLLALGAPGALHANCPDGRDLAGGIVFTGPDGEREVFTGLGDGMVSASYRYPDGYATEALLAHGVFLIELHDRIGTEGESLTNYEFPMDIKDIQLPTAGWSWEVTVSATDGNNNVFERQVYTFGPVELQSYGACAYDVIPFTAEYSTAPDVVETYHYLPELGLSYLYAYLDPTGEAVYPYTMIEVVR